MNTKSAHVDVVILCGGKGERLREVIGDMPKPMALIKGTPFLRILIDHIASFGHKRFILCVGYKRAIIKEYIEKSKLPLEIIFSDESSPLGTGGALKNASQQINSPQFLVVNGDSFFRIDYHDFLVFHARKKSDCSIALFKPLHGSKDYGDVVLNDESRITSFREKQGFVNEDGLCNGGIYVFQKDIFSAMPESDAFSLEYDLFPSVLTKNVFGYIAEEQFIDIGTPDRYKHAQHILERE